MRIDHGLLPGHVLQRQPRGARTVVTGTCADPGCSGAVLATVRRGSTALKGLKAKPVGAAADGRFTATVTGLPTGGPYSVELTCGTERLTVADVFVGDLWLMAGQSNMQGIGNMADAPEPHPLVRNFTRARTWELARDPLHFLAESPDKVHGGLPLHPREAAKAKRKEVKGAGVGIPFGTLMHTRSGVPQGLIATARGGTSMAQWNPALKDQGGDSMYGSMWLSVQAVGQPIAGVLWYQGCSDAGPEAAKIYTGRMQELVAAVRRDLGQPKLPWIIVQIGRVIEAARDGRPWNDIQEQQRRLPESIPGCDVVPAVDLDLDDGIHISTRAFPELAQRMARVAARLACNDRTEKPALQPVSARFLEPKPGFGMGVEVRFAHVVGGLHSTGLAQGFSLLDRLGRPLRAIYKTVLMRDRVHLYVNGMCPSGMQVSYGHGVNPVCNVSDGRGMAVPVFGPLAITGLPAVSDFFLRWRVTPIRPGEDIAGMLPPGIDDATAIDRCFDRSGVTDFVNLHPEWEGHSGHVAFIGHVDTAEAMAVEVRFGYDGPIRLWIGDREVHTDLKGTNPALRDAHCIPLRLAAGRSPIRVLMALNHGRAWGFFLRLSRTEVDPTTVPVMPIPWT